MTSPLLAYLPWHLRDALGRALAAPILFLVMGVLPLWGVASSRGIAEMREGGAVHQQSLLMYSSSLGLVIALGAILAASGFIALDRDRQHFRFLFSHPVAPWRYYLQRYLVAASLYAILVMAIPLGYRLVVAPVPVLGVGAIALLYALLYGSLAMLCGALLNRDGLAFIGIFVVSNVLQSSREVLARWLVVIADALPPFSKLGGIRDAVLRGMAVDTGDVTHVVAYGVAMLAAALFIVRRAPLAR